MPAWNAADTIGPAIRSLLHQTRRPDEIVVVDDGSSDDTAAVVRSLARRRRSGINLVRTAHRGLVPALNAGLAAASGTLIARMDADDLARRERLAMQARILATHPEVGVVGGAAEIPRRDGNAGYRRYGAWVNRLTHWRQIRRARFIESPLVHPTVVYRRHLVTNHGGYREGPFPEDYELWLRWFAAGVRAVAVPEPVITWRDDPRRFSRTPSAMQARDAFFAVKGSYLAREVFHRADARPVFLWGGGRRTRRRMEPFVRALADLTGDAQPPVAAVVDLSARPSTGLAEREVPVLPPERVPPPTAGYVVAAVTTPGARHRIAAHLAARGYRYERDWIAAG